MALHFVALVTCLVHNGYQCLVLFLLAEDTPDNVAAKLMRAAMIGASQGVTAVANLSIAVHTQTALAECMRAS